MASTRDYSIMNSIDNQAGPSVLTPSDGSRTTTITEDAPRLEPSSNRILRLRGGPRTEQRVAWDEDVVDNEGSGRKSSKICCIYHKPRKFDESSSEESSSDSEDSDSSCSNNPQSQHRHRHRHRHDHGHGHNHRPLSDRPNEMQPAEVHELEKDSDRNAYEIMPSSKQGKRKEIH